MCVKDRIERLTYTPRRRLARKAGLAVAEDLDFRSERCNGDGDTDDRKGKYKPGGTLAIDCARHGCVGEGPCCTVPNDREREKEAIHPRIGGMSLRPPGIALG